MQEFPKDVHVAVVGTMASTCRSGETPSDPAGDLSTLIFKGSVDEEVLKQYAEKGQIDLPDKDDKTPLMLACWYGRTDTVQSLLANGASPNSRSVKDGNTPMHYACMVEGPLAEDSLSGTYYRPSKWMAAKLAIIKLLVSNGALAVQDNLYGWSPVYVAALYLLTDVVEFLLSMADISLEVKMAATEILGVSQATLDERHCFKEAYPSFTRAISFQQDSSFPEAQTNTSELAACFSKISLKECRTQEEIFLIRASEVATKAHAFLVGERLFPNNLKQKYLYPSLVSFASDCMIEKKMFEEGSQVLSFALGLEREGELKLGSVAVNLAKKSGSFIFEDKEPNVQYHTCARDLLCAYKSMLSHVPMDSLLDYKGSLIESYGEILFNVAFYCSNIEILKSTLQAIGKSLTVIQCRTLRENPDKYPEMPSVAFKIMELLGEAYGDNFYCGMSSRALLRVKFTISKILFGDNALYVDSSGSNILHLVAHCVQAARDHDYLVDLTRIFVRHGCPVDVVNNDGETACSILEQHAMYDEYECDPEFLMLVSPPTAVLRLEEVAIRAVLRHHINYQGILPSSLCMMIEDGVKESEIERGNEGSEIESEDEK